MTTPDYTNNYLIEDIAAEHHMSINKERASAILEKLEANELKYGKPYCPCLNNHTEDTICPCRYMREHKACRCGLYVKQKEEM